MKTETAMENIQIHRLAPAQMEKLCHKRGATLSRIMVPMSAWALLSVKEMLSLKIQTVHKHCKKKQAKKENEISTRKVTRVQNILERLTSTHKIQISAVRLIELPTSTSLAFSVSNWNKLTKYMVLESNTGETK